MLESKLMIILNIFLLSDNSSNNQTQNDPNNQDPSLYSLPPQPSEDVLDLEASRSEETHKKHQKANKAPHTC